MLRLIIKTCSFLPPVQPPSSQRQPLFPLGAVSLIFTSIFLVNTHIQLQLFLAVLHIIHCCLLWIMRILALFFLPSSISVQVYHDFCLNPYYNIFSINAMKIWFTVEPKITISFFIHFPPRAYEMAHFKICLFFFTPRILLSTIFHISYTFHPGDICPKALH